MVTDFEGLRWICKSAVLQKWYLRALRPRLRAQLRPCRVQSYGFRRLTSTADLTGLVRELQYIARTWGYPLLISCQDIRWAFDSLPHELISEALLARGVSPLDVGLHMRELTALTATITLPFVGSTAPFAFNKGGKQGGIETPDEWRAVVDYIMEPIVISWNERNVGFQLRDTETNVLVNHAVWADNIVLFASSYSEMQLMIGDLNRACATYTSRSGVRHLCWKPDSLECIASGTLRDVEPVALALQQDQHLLKYKQKEKIILLGDLLDQDGSTQSSVEYNLSRAEAHYYKHREVLSNRAMPVGKRLQARAKSSSTVGAYNGETWHLTAKILSDLRTWELKMLRRLLQLRRRPQESYQYYNQRTAAMVDKWCSDNGVLPLYGKVLKAVFKAAWRESMFSLDGGISPLRQVRLYRTEVWWQTCCALTDPAKRRRLGVKHSTRGRSAAAWEHPFVVLWGCQWREKRQECKSLRSWMALFGHFAFGVCDLWGLPQLSVGLARGDESPGRSLQTYKLPTSLADMPELPQNPKEHGWSTQGKRVWIQTDNQTLAELFGGRAVLDLDELRPPCVRASRALQTLMAKEWLPRTSVSDIIEWDRREYNVVADFCANVAVEDQQDWYTQWAREIQEAQRRGCNIRACFDGARKGNGASSAGVAIYAYHFDGARVMLACGGKQLGNLNSSLAAEILSLEWCLEVVLAIMGK